MTKHPGPWKVGSFNYIGDANGLDVFKICTDDPETRAVLLHAAEMWRALRSNMGHINDEGDSLIRKIEAEIAAGRTT